LSQDVAYVNTAAREIIDTTIGRDRIQYEFLRYVLRNVGASMEYPLNRFSRVELGAQFSSIGQSIVNQNYDYYFDHIDVNFETVAKLRTYNYISPLVAYVTD